MSIATSLLMLAAAAAPQVSRPPAPPAQSAAAIVPASSHGVSFRATAQVSATILRPAVVDISALASGRRDTLRSGTIYRQIDRQGLHVSVDFN